MKRALCVLICLLLCPVFCLAVGAETYEEIPEGFRGFLDALPDEIAELLPQGFFSQEADDVASTLSTFGTFPSILSYVKELLQSFFGSLFGLFCELLGLLLLSKVLDDLGDTLSLSLGLASAFGFLKRLLVVIFLLRFGYVSLARVTAYLSALGRMTSAAIPLLGTLYALGGNVSAAVASSSGLSISLVLTERLVGTTILPFCALCLGLSLVELFTPFSTKALTDAIKKNYTTALSFLMVILLALLGGQTTLGARADTLAAKGAKFAAGAMIPVAGGSISELLLSVGAGVSYLRGVCGICGLLLLLLVLLPTLLQLFCHRLLWQVAEGVADLFGCKEEKRLFSEFSSLCGYLVASLLICSSALFLSFILVVGCAGAWG